MKSGRNELENKVPNSVGADVEGDQTSSKDKFNKEADGFEIIDADDDTADVNPLIDGDMGASSVGASDSESKEERGNSYDPCLDFRPNPTVGVSDESSELNNNDMICAQRKKR
jgi:hypothetical protein